MQKKTSSYLRWQQLTLSTLTIQRFRLPARFHWKDNTVDIDFFIKQHCLWPLISNKISRCFTIPFLFIKFEMTFWETTKLIGPLVVFNILLPTWDVYSDVKISVELILGGNQSCFSHLGSGSTNNYQGICQDGIQRNYKFAFLLLGRYYETFWHVKSRISRTT